MQVSIGREHITVLSSDRYDDGQVIESVMVDMGGYDERGMVVRNPGERDVLFVQGQDEEVTLDG